MTPVHLRVLSGSLRRDSFNTALARTVVELAPEGVIAELLAYRDVPLYDADLGIPPAVEAFKDAITRADGLVFCTPEYNLSVPGVLKNAIDWASRPAYRSPLLHKPVLVMSASTSLIGGARAQQHLKTVLLGTASHVFPSQEFCVIRAADKIIGGRLSDPPSRERLAALLSAFVAEVRLRKGF